MYSNFFRERPNNTWDYSHKHDLISLGARLSKDAGGTQHERSVGSHTKTSNVVNAHNLNRIQTDHHEHVPTPSVTEYKIDPQLMNNTKLVFS